MLWVFFYFFNNLLYIYCITILDGQFCDYYENNGPRVNKKVSLLRLYVIVFHEQCVANWTSKDIMISYMFNQQFCNAFSPHDVDQSERIFLCTDVFDHF